MKVTRTIHDLVEVKGLSVSIEYTSKGVPLRVHVSHEDGRPHRPIALEDDPEVLERVALILKAQRETFTGFTVLHHYGVCIDHGYQPWETDGAGVPMCGACLQEERALDSVQRLEGNDEAP